MKSPHLASIIGLWGAVLTAPSVTAQLPPGGPWALRFVDEFNDTHAGNPMGLDPDKWSPAYPWTRVHNYPAYIRDDNIRVNTNSNGLLQLWGRRESYMGQPFTSGAINSNGHFNFGLTGQAGYMEARMRMPNFLGAWPAFWSLQEGWPPEIDVMEFVRNGPGSANTSPNNYVANVHFRNSAGQNASSWSGFRDAGAGDLTAGFHNYGFRWNDNTLTWYIDGRQFHSYTGAAAIAQMQRMYLILNLGIGGWPGDPPATENVNKSFDIDWVRVWQAADAPQSSYVGPAGGNQNWDAAANWSNGAPKLSSTTAVFGNLTGGSAVTLDWVDNKTVRGLTFRTGSSYHIGWADDLLVLSNWDTSASAVPEALVDVQVDPGSAVQGAQTIASRVELHSNTRVKNATGNVLTFSGDVHGGGTLTLDSGRTNFGGAVLHRGGTNVVGSADATFTGRLGTSGSTINVGTAAGSNSTLRLAPTATNVAASQLRVGETGGRGTLVQSGGAVTVTGGEVWVGQGAGSNGTYDHTGGSLAVGNWLAVGREGGTGTYRLGGTAVLNKTGAGNVVIGSLGGAGTFTQAGGAVNVTSGNTLLGEGAGASGTYTITGGTAALNDVVLSQSGDGAGTFDLAGGVVTANRARRAGTGTGTFNFDGGTLRAAGSTPTFMQGLTAATVRAGGARIDTAGHTVTIAQPLLDGGGGAGGLTKVGPGTLTLAARNTYRGATTVEAGRLSFAASQRLSHLNVGAGATAAIAPGAARAIVAEQLNLAGVPGAWTGSLDVADGGLAIDYTPGGPSPMPTLLDQLRHGRAGGAWDGRGIFSSTAAAAVERGDPDYALGFAAASDVLGPAGGDFLGETVDASSALVRFTLVGDTDLDGAVTGDDVLRLRRNMRRPGTWSTGDFDYDGRVSALDYAALRRNLGSSMASFDAALFAGLGSVQGQVESVPEPTSAGLIVVVTAALLRRRRRS